MVKSREKCLGQKKCEQIEETAQFTQGDRMEMANSLEEMHAQITQSHLLVKEVETCCRRRMSLKPAFCASHFKRTLCKWKCSFPPK